jgi:hypothetical protein
MIEGFAPRCAYENAVMTSEFGVQGRCKSRVQIADNVGNTAWRVTQRHFQDDNCLVSEIPVLSTE